MYRTSCTCHDKCVVFVVHIVTRRVGNMYRLYQVCPSQVVTRCVVCLVEDVTNCEKIEYP